MNLLDILFTITIYPITQILEFTFFISQYLFAESGISVFFISIFISLLCLPLYAVAEKWQHLQRETERKFRPKIKKIKDVFKGDEQYMLLSVYYRQNNYHPIYSLRSSFGLLIQIPFFIAAYSYLSHLELLQGSSFYIITDLGSPDSLLSFNGFSINLMPFFMTLINFFSVAVYTKDFPVKDKLQLYGMSLFFLILLYNSPSALVLYWTINNILSLIKNIYYRMNYKYKRIILMGFFSVVFIISSAFFSINYSYSIKGEKLIVFCFIAALIPWILFFFKKQLIKIYNVDYSEKDTFLLFFLSCLFLFLLFGLFIPSQLIASSPQEFSYIDNYENPLFFIWNTSLQLFGLFFSLPFCIYFLLSNKIKNIFSVCFSTLCFCMVINIFIFPGNYGVVSIDFTFAEDIIHSIPENIFNIVFLILVFTIVFFLNIKYNKKIIITIVSLLIFSTLSISVYNLFKINDSFSQLKTFYVRQEEKKNAVSPIFTFSNTGKNIVIIMLDRAISVFIPFIMEELPELDEKFSGFVYYPNTVSFHGFTGGGAPPVYGGYEYTPEEMNKNNGLSHTEKFNQSLLLLPIIFSENNFIVYVTDPPYANLNWKSDLGIYDQYKNVHALFTESQYTDIWLKEHGIKVPALSSVIKRNMAWYSLHKGLPLVIRDLLYINGNWCSPALNNGLRLMINGYSVLDYMPRLTQISNSAIDIAIIMTNNTTHERLFLQAPEYVPVVNVTNYGKSPFAKDWNYHINAGALKRLADWFDFLKKESVYDNTKIILVSDHGPVQNFVTKIGLPFNVDQFNPLLMVKDFNSTGVMKTDMTFMSNADVPYLALYDVIKDPKNPFTGNPINMDRKKEPLYIAVSGSMHLSDNRNISGRDNYLVKDNIFIAENWQPVTGE